MTAISRQNTLFVAEPWTRIYEALTFVDFRAYDFDNLVQALLNYIKVNYPDEYNDWIASSEFITKVEILAFLSQNLAFRVDLNSRENFLATAERRESLIRLAQNIAYNVNRVRGSRGLVKIVSVKTNQSLRDSNNVSLQDKIIRWNDPRNEDWYEQFVLVMNSALSVRTKFGKPVVTNTTEGVKTDQYVFRAIAPSSGTFSVTASVNGVNLPFNVHNATLDASSGVINEIAPSNTNAMNIFYQADGRGFGSANTGFFFPIKQGSLAYLDQDFTDPVVLRTLDINVDNINNDDFFVQKIDNNGNVLENWTKVDTVFGESVSFTTTQDTASNTVYELSTLTNDKVRVRFGDGAFGEIPVGRFRFWYRTSNPQPLYVKPTAIQNQVIVLPYAVDNQLYYLTLTYSLQTTMSNAAASETNFDIRTRANKVFYTQNRMITGQDYNNFFLKDNSIKKVKTINRTYSGHSRYVKLNDPTSLFQNVKHVAEDGRFYQNATSVIELVNAATDTVSINALLNQYVKPVIRKPDKQLLYYNRYVEIALEKAYLWGQTSVVADQSQGNILDNNTPIVVGPTSTTKSSYINTDALLRYGGPKGPFVSVDHIVGDGTGTNGIVLKTTIPDKSTVVSVFPPLRNQFTGPELLAVQDGLSKELDFGVSWNQATATWNIIVFSDIDKTSAFSLDHQGDTTGTNKDASWMILFEFVPAQDQNQWRITDRGIGLFFESSREVDFIFINRDSTIDPETGEVVNDEVKILACNESRDSLRRRGLTPVGNTSCAINAYQFVGDGVTQCFKTSETLVSANTVITINGIYQAYGVDWSITPSPTGDSICFGVTPEHGAVIIVRISNQFVNATITNVRFIGDGNTEEYDLGQRSVVAANVLTFLDGITQNSSLDFGIGKIGVNASIIYNEVLAPGVVGDCYVISGIDSTVFNKENFTGDGIKTSYISTTGQQTKDTLLIALDGVIQAPSQYDLVSTDNSTTITFHNAPSDSVKIRMIAVANPQLAKTRLYEFTSDGLNNTYDLTDILKITPEKVLVFADGILQEGPFSPSSVWSITGDHLLFFPTPLGAGVNIVVFVIAGVSGTLLNDPNETPQDTARDNLGAIDTSSCLVHYLGDDVPLFVNDVIRHPDGYVNVNGISVIPADVDHSGSFDNPLIFRDLVILDGYTDLVLWRQVEQYGFDVWDPINKLTSPKGTYGLSGKGDPKAGDVYDAVVVKPGDIHLDMTTQTWLVADSASGKWIAAPDQTKFKKLIGRDHLKFLWQHYAPEAYRIDPSVSNIMNAYILTSRFDLAYRTWIQNNGSASDEPTPPTSDDLRIEYSDFNQFKAMSDAIIYYPARYKPLFGNQAIPELRATFKIMQTSGSTISESDLRLRVLTAINNYFDVDRWDFGESFYFTELCAYVHAQLAPDLQTIVIVPRDNNQAFGRLFQVRAEPDELFINSAQPDDIEIVTALADDELRIGTLV